MKKIKKMVCLAASVALVAGLVGCGSSSNSGSTTNTDTSTSEDTTSTDTSSSDKPYIAMIAKGFQHQFWQVVKKGAEDAAKDLNVNITFEGPATESDINDQVNMVNAALAKNPVALGVAALDTKALSSQLAEAQSKKIPVVGFDSGIPDAPEGQVAATASTNNYNAAKLAAEEMIKSEELVANIKGATKDNPIVIGVLSQDATSASIVDRTAGFIDEMKKQCEDLVGAGSVDVSGHDNFKSPATGDTLVKIVVNVPPTTAATDMQNGAQALLGTKSIVGLYGSNAGSVDGILAASSDGKDFDKTSGKYKDVVVVGFDSSKGQKTAVENGWFLGSITQDPYQIGYQAVELAYKAYKGEAVSDVDTGAKWYNADNMNDADIKDLLYD